MKIREAKLSDAFDIAMLSSENGRFTLVDTVSDNLKRLLESVQDSVLVMEHDDLVIGWLHIRLTTLLDAPICAEVSGIVVKEDFRRKGIGMILMNTAESWVRANGLNSLIVRAGDDVKGAHHFYENLGYIKIKYQPAYKKELIL